MKRQIIILTLVFCCAAFLSNSVFGSNIEKTNPYDKDWKTVDSLIGKGLTKTALEVVGKIYTTAKKENNTGQFVKAVIYKMKLQDQYQEESFVLIINQLNAEIDTAVFPVKPILHSMLAEMYWHYYQSNRYQFLNRTETANFKEDDIRTWDLKKIAEQTIKHYLASLEDESKLKTTPINVYDNFLVKYGSATIRPTLFDFLGHRAVDFFSGEEPGLIRPAYKFEIDNEDYFSMNAAFSKLSNTNNFVPLIWGFTHFSI